MFAVGSDAAQALSALVGLVAGAAKEQQRSAGYACVEGAGFVGGGGHRAVGVGCNPILNVPQVVSPKVCRWPMSGSSTR